MNFHSFLGIIIFCAFVDGLQGNNDKSNPCDGKVFSLVCTILQRIRKNIDSSKEHVEERLKDIEKRHLHDRSEVKELMEDVKGLFTKHTSDIIKVTSITTTRINALSNLLQNRIQVTEHEMETKIDSISGLVEDDVTKVQQLGERFDKIKGISKNVTMEMKRLIDRHVSSIYRNHADDILKLTKMTEKRTIALSHLLINRIHVTKHAIDQNINNVIKLVEDDTKKIIQINERFAALKRMRTNDTQAIIKREVGNLTSIHTADIRKLNKMLDVGLKELTRLLEYRIQVLQDAMDNKTKDVIRSFDEEYDELISILKQTDNNTIINKKSIMKMKVEIEENEKTSIISRQNQTIDIVDDVTSKLTRMKEMFVNNISEVTNALMKKIEQNTQQLKAMERKLDKKECVKWPAGHYCILANGSCPSGFTFSSGYMKGISLASSTSWYIREAKFGNSQIKCHGRCGHYGSWIGELYIATCCK